MRKVYVDGNCWNRDLCNSNLDSLFIFGDNFNDDKPISKIKVCSNVIGIPIKKNKNEFFEDINFEDNIKFIDGVFDRIMKVILYNNYRSVVISEKIFSLSCFGEKAPMTYNHIGKRITALVNMFNYKKIEFYLCI